MEKVALCAIIFLVILIAILFIVPNEQMEGHQRSQVIEIQRHSSDLINVQDILVTPEGLLCITYADETGLRTFHHFVNLKASNVTLVEDEEFEPEKILISDTFHGGLEITVAKSLNLNLSPFATNSDSLKPAALPH